MLINMVYLKYLVATVFWHNGILHMLIIQVITENITELDTKKHGVVGDLYHINCDILL